MKFIIAILICVPVIFFLLLLFMPVIIYRSRFDKNGMKIDNKDYGIGGTN